MLRVRLSFEPRSHASERFALVIAPTVSVDDIGKLFNRYAANIGQRNISQLAAAIQKLFSFPELCAANQRMGMATSKEPPLQFVCACTCLLFVPDVSIMNRAGRRSLAGFLGYLPFSLPWNSDTAPYSPRFTPIGSQHLDVKNRPNFSTPLLHSVHVISEYLKYPEPLVNMQDNVGSFIAFHCDSHTYDDGGVTEPPVTHPSKMACKILKCLSAISACMQQPVRLEASSQSLAQSIGECVRLHGRKFQARSPLCALVNSATPAGLYSLACSTESVARLQAFQVFAFGRLLSGEILAALNIEVLRAYEGETRSIRRLMKCDVLRRSAQQASWDVHLGRCHVTPVAALHCSHIGIEKERSEFVPSVLRKSRLGNDPVSLFRNASLVAGAFMIQHNDVHYLDIIQNKILIDGNNNFFLDVVCRVCQSLRHLVTCRKTDTRDLGGPPNAHRPFWLPRLLSHGTSGSRVNRSSAASPSERDSVTARTLVCISTLRSFSQEWPGSALSCVIGKVSVVPSSVSEEPSNEVKASLSMSKWAISACERVRTGQKDRSPTNGFIIPSHFGSYRACCYDSDACVISVDRRGSYAATTWYWTTQCVDLYASTVLRRLLRAGLVAHMPLCRLPLSRNHKRLRRQWAYECRRWRANDNYIRVRRYRVDRNFAACIVERHSGQMLSVMVWGAIGYNMRSRLLRIEGSLNRNHYGRNFLEPKALPLLQVTPRAIFQ
ncbi:hypothetical protein PR048_005742 [Dryococelus australis]|uniref:Transposase Tc1-like domain-containing protein n=1 Tax=Dryococelus australis TaxID=614101 RepID=A0ABQ9I914_9NEOP|nr:hypothetical protein PR048_005742 [Dryococelus australis]